MESPSEHVELDPCDHFVVNHGVCDECGEIVDEDAYAEWVSDREAEDGEQFRGKEAEAFWREEQARIQRELK